MKIPWPIARMCTRQPINFTSWAGQPTRMPFIFRTSPPLIPYKLP
jgi:hypothetical protein